MITLATLVRQALQMDQLDRSLLIDALKLKRTEVAESINAIAVPTVANRNADGLLSIETKNKLERLRRRMVRLDDALSVLNSKAVAS